MEKAQLENGYTKIANQIIEKMLVINLGPYETRVLMCIIRKTYGWKKKSDWIANSQIVTETGIHKAHVSRAVAKLKNRNIVTQTGNELGINTNTSSWLPEQVTRNELPKRATPVARTGNKQLPKRADTKEKKETIQKKIYIRIEEIGEDVFENISSDYGVPISFVRSKYDDMVNWHESTGKKKKNWVATLRNFVKKDAIKLKQEVYGKSTIAYIKTE